MPKPHQLSGVEYDHIEAALTEGVTLASEARRVGLRVETLRQRLVLSGRRYSRYHAADQLSSREARVVALLNEGWSLASVARELGVTPNAIRVYRYRAKAKHAWR